MIRQATIEDLRRIVEMSEQFYPQTPYINLAPFNPAAAANLATFLIESGIMLVAEIEEEVVGMVGLVITPFPFEPELLGAYEVIWWVEPSAQSKGVGQALLAAIDDTAKEQNCNYIHMVCMANSPPAAAGLYFKYGYDHTEMSFTKRL
jgi:GNAT superfamily N-acetyltransferase